MPRAVVGLPTALLAVGVTRLARVCVCVHSRGPKDRHVYDGPWPHVGLQSRRLVRVALRRMLHLRHVRDGSLSAFQHSSGAAGVAIESRLQKGHLSRTRRELRLGCSPQLWIAIAWLPWWLGFPLVSPWFPFGFLLVYLWFPFALPWFSS